MQRFRPYSRYIKFIVYLVVIILFNAVGSTLFFRLDLTANRMYSISPASRKVVATLSEPLTINVFFTKNLPAPHNNTERYLHDLLEEYALHANRYFNFHFYNVSPAAEGMPASAQENQKLADNYGIHPIQIQVVEKDEVKFKKAYMGLVLIHGDLVERIATITSIEGLEYKLTSAMQKLNNKVSAFLSLRDKIQATLYLSSSLQQVAPMVGLQALAGYPEQVRRIVERINAKLYNKIEYRYLDPTHDKAAEAALAKYKLTTLNWPEIPEKRIPAGQGTIGMVISYGEKARELQLLNVMRIPIIGTQYDLLGTDEIEARIQESLEALIDINEDIGYLTDHGTLPFGASRFGQDPESLSSFATLVSRNYTLKPLNLKKGPIPDGLGCLIIARPSAPFSDWDLYQIDQALMRGTNLALFLDPFLEINPKQGRGPVLVPIDSGLEKLLEHYGLRVKKGFVMDERCHIQMMPQQYGGGDQPIYFAPIIKNRNINHTPKFMQHIKGLVTFKIAPLELDEQRFSDLKLKAERLFSSSRRSWEMRQNINLNPMFIKPPADDKMQRFPLAYLVEGEFPSYFKGKPIPEKPPEEKNKDDKTAEAPQTPAPGTHKVQGEGVMRTQSRPAKILLIGSSEQLKDRLLEPEGQSPNAMFIMNALDVLNDREDMAVMRSKVQHFNPLQETGAPVKTFIKTFNIVGLPILVVLYGVFVWFRRISRKKQIQMMFQE